MTRDRIPEEVADQLKWYVYRLIDPRDGETFYVGKGRADRVFVHARGEEVALALDEEEKIIDPKLRRIKDITAAGLEVGHIIHRHGLSTSQIAYEVEAAVIDAYAGLTNKVRGHGTRDHGSQHVEQIIREYSAEEFEVKESLLMISIGVFYYRRNTPYDAVRYAWRVNLDRARRCQLVLARLRGLVVGAYRPKVWLPATRENFPDLAKSYSDVDDIPGFHGFVGEDAEAEVWDYYVDKRVPERFRRSRIAIRYLDPGT